MEKRKIKTWVCTSAALALMAGTMVGPTSSLAANVLLDKPVIEGPVGQKGPAAADEPTPPDSTPFATVPGGSVGGLVFADTSQILLLAAEVGSARTERDDDGNAYIAGQIDGINYSIDVYNCDPDCADLAFTASFEVTGVDSNLMNDWNSSRRFGKAFIRSDGDAVLQMAINTRYGITVETFRDDLEWWSVVLEDYVSFIGFR